MICKCAPLGLWSAAVALLLLSGLWALFGMARPAADQRKGARPFDGNEDGTAVCDVGAVEVVSGNGYVILLPAVTR